MKKWLLVILTVGTCWTTPTEAGLGLFRGRRVAVAESPSPVTTYAAGQSVAGQVVPSAYAVPNSAAYPTGYVLPGTTYSRGYTGVATAPTSGPELIDPNPPARPYSYYVAQPGTARGYYGYGQDGFPYYGRPYGHPYDPWTWPYMTDSFQNSLHHYYYPPIPAPVR